MNSSSGATNADPGYDSVKESVDRERKFSPEKMARPLETWEPIVGGIIVISMGVLVMMDAFANLNNDVYGFWMIPFELSASYQQISFISVAGAILAVVGGEMAVLRISYRIALIGGFSCAAAAWLWYNWPGLVVGLVGTILISLSSEQFTRSKTDSPLENLILGKEQPD